MTTGPMSQVGCASASSGVTSCSSSRRAAPERSAARGQHEAAYLLRGAAAQALGERAVLGVDRHDLPGPGAAGDHRAADDQRLLVRQRERGAGVERGEGGPQPDGAGHPVEHDVAGQPGRLDRRPPRRARRDRAGRELGDLPLEQLGREPPAVSPDHPEPVGVGPDHVEGLGADRPRGAEDHDVAGFAHRAIVIGKPTVPAIPAISSPGTGDRAHGRADLRWFGVTPADTGQRSTWAYPRSGRGSELPGAPCASPRSLVFLGLFSYFYGPPLTERLARSAHAECNRLTGSTYRTYRSSGARRRTASVTGRTGSATTSREPLRHRHRPRLVDRA